MLLSPDDVSVPRWRGGTEGSVKNIEEGCKKKFVDSIFFYTFVRKLIKINKQ